MADYVLDIVLRTIMKGSGAKDTAKEVGNLKTKLNDTVKELTGFSLGSLTVGGILATTVGHLKKVTAEWSQYAEGIQKAADLSGISTEEMSRLTQAADDFRVEQSALQSAMAMALKNGFVPTIDNIAVLSDELIAIEDPAERAQRASAIFGKQWQEIAPLLLKGSTAIKAQAAAVDDSLIVTEQAAKENKEYIEAMDELDDAMTGFNNMLARGVIPSWTKFIQLLTDPDAQSAANLINTMFRGTFLESSLNKETRAIIEKWQTAEPLAADMNERLHEMGPAGETAAAGILALGDAQSTEIEKADRLKVIMGELTASVLFNQAAAGLDADASYRLAKSMGLIDDESEAAMIALDDIKAKYDTNKDGAMSADEATEGYVDEVSRLNTMIGYLQDKKITITTTFINEYVESGHRGDTGGYTGVEEQERAAGGMGYPGQGYWVGEYGPEWRRPKETEEIVPTGKAATAAAGSGISIGNITLPGVTNVQQFLVELARLARNKQAAGAGYIGA